MLTETTEIILVIAKSIETLKNPVFGKTIQNIRN